MEIVITSIITLVCMFLLAILSCVSAFKTRATYVFLICEAVYVAVILADGDLVLGVIEFVIFQIIFLSIIFGMLYSTTALDRPVHFMFTISCAIFYLGVFALTIIREVALFPFWEKGLATFTISILVLFLTLSIATDCQDSCAVNDSRFFDYIVECFLVTILYVIACGLIIGLPYLAIYRVRDGYSAETISKSVTAEYELAPDGSGYYLTEQLDKVVGADYFTFRAIDEASANTIGGEKIKMRIAHTKIHESNSATPHLEVITNYYTNIRGEDQIRDYEYTVYVPTGTIDWLD